MKARRPLPYRSGIGAHIPLTVEEMFWRVLLNYMRTCLEIYHPRETTRWN